MESGTGIAVKCGFLRLNNIAPQNKEVAHKAKWTSTNTILTQSLQTLTKKDILLNGRTVFNICTVCLSEKIETTMDVV